MSRRPFAAITAAEKLTVAAGLSVLLAAAALYPMFSSSEWVWKVVGTVPAVVFAGLLGRRLGLPRSLQPVLGTAFAFLYLCVTFGRDTLIWGVLPTGRTIELFSTLSSSASADVQRYSAPVPTTAGLVLLTAAGVGLVAVLVDLVAVVFERAAAAGLPLLMLFAVPSAVLPGGLGGIPFLLGALGWLLLLLVEGNERISRWGAPLRAALPGARAGGDDRGLGRVGRRIGFSALGVAVIVPLLVPGLDHRLIGGSGPGGQGKDGSDSAHTYNPITRLRDQLSLPNPVQLFQYRTDDPSPDYLRMTTLDQYNGFGWSASALSQLRDEARVQKGIKAPVGDGGPHQRLHARIQVDGSHLDVFWLPLPYGPTKVSVAGTWLWDPSSQTVFSASRTTRDLPAYDVEANRVLPDRTRLAGANLDAVDPSVHQRYGTAIPTSAYVRSLTAQVVKGAATEFDKAVALQAFFTNPKNHFVYDLNPSVAALGQDPLEAFLRGKHGFCEQYATAMAAMLRVAGVPSRVAVGFTKGALLKGSSDTYSVGTSDAHAWPEAWFAGTGWVRFEPTPSASGAIVPDYSKPASVAPVPGQGSDGGPKPTPTPTASGLRPEHSDLLRNEGKGGVAATSTRAAATRRTWLFVVVPLVVLLLLAVPSLFTLVRRRRRWRHPDALRAWEQVCDDAVDVGHLWRAADSPRAAAARLVRSRALADGADLALGRLALAAERYRYAPPGRRVTESGLAADVAIVRSALRRSCPRSARVRALVLPPSTVRWATERLGT